MKPTHWSLFVGLLLVVAFASYQLGALRSGSQPENALDRNEALPEFAKMGASGASSPPRDRPSASASQVSAGPAWKAVQDSSLHWERRIEAVRQMLQQADGPLNETVVKALVEFMHKPPPGARNEWYLVCNEIMGLLQSRNLAPESFSRHMLGLVQDATTDPVIRDYAVQSLAHWLCAPDQTLGHETDSEVTRRSFDALLEEAQKPGNGALTLVGTTLLAFADGVLNGTPEMQAERDRVAVAAIALASGKLLVSSFNRSAAIQAASRLHADGLLEICRGLVRDSEAHPDVRLSAVAALGEIGAGEDAAVLQPLSHDVRFEYAVKAALARLAKP